MAKLKILYIVTQGEWGGAQRYVFDLATNLANEFVITIAIGEPEGRCDLQDKMKQWNEGRGTRDVNIIQLKHLVRKISPIHDILAIFELAKLYKTIKPDIIHLNSSKASILGSFAFSFFVPRASSDIYTVHGWVFNEPLNQFKKTLYRWLEKFTAKWKDKIIVLSDSDYQTGQQAGISTNKLIKIPLGISPPIFLSKEKARQELSKLSHISYLPSHTIVGTIANLYPTKGLDTLIEAINIINIKYQISNIKFFIVGDGPEKNNLQSLITKYGLQNVHLLGAIDNAAQYLPAFDIFVLPSRKEGMPYTLLEAVAAGLPIVATNVGGVKELIIDAIILNDPKILAEKIIQTIKNPIYQYKNTTPLGEMLEKTKTTYFSYRHPLS